MATGPAEPQMPARYRYLPRLSLLLVALSLFLLVKLYLRLPTNERERRTASFHTALELISQCAFQ